MSITSKTRKRLWAHSGNKCAICRIELVSATTKSNKSLNIGDECHIISEQKNGIRHVPNLKYDEFDNLIILCKNHHRKIDELWETYTVDLLRTIKNLHENWVSQTLNSADTKSKARLPSLLPRLYKGKQIVDIILSAHAYQFDYDECKSEEESQFVSSFLQNTQDWGEVSGMSNFEIGQIVQLGFDLNKEIEKLEERGFLIFGERKRVRMKSANDEDLGIWNIATIVVMRKDNPAIIDSELLLALIESIHT